LEKGDEDEISNSRLSALRRRRSTYGFANTAFVESSHSLFYRPKKSFDAAIKTLSATLNGRKAGMSMNPTDSSGHSTSSDLSLGSSLDLRDGSPYDDRSAENARRRQMILISIIIELQAHCRTFIVLQRKERREQGIKLLQTRSKSGVISSDLAASVIQARYRSKFYQARLNRLRSAVAKVSAFFRGSQIRTIVRIIRRTVVIVQAVIRGFLVRRRISAIISARLDIYRRQIFELWHLLMTPLCCRSVLWNFLRLDESCRGFVRLALAEDELRRLWNRLRDDDTLSESAFEHHGMTTRMRNNTFNKAMAVQCLLTNDRGSATLLKPMNGTTWSISNSLIAERTQVYDTLTKMDEAEVEALFGRFSINQSCKRKKASLAQMICKYCIGLSRLVVNHR
jgi:hypothetical protein